MTKIKAKRKDAKDKRKTQFFDFIKRQFFLVPFPPFFAS